MTPKERLELEHRANADNAATRRRLVELQSLAAKTDAWPSDPELADKSQEHADAWVREGVARLARASKSEHVVLMAATHSDGAVGVGSSLKCDTLVAMQALGELVAEVNRSFTRDGVKARLNLRMRLLDDPAAPVALHNR